MYGNGVLTGLILHTIRKALVKIQQGLPQGVAGWGVVDHG
jgi:hypothetical protein